jgi:Long-chain acyl-CoA synthetases (AMP-forming)
MTETLAQIFLNTEKTYPGKALMLVKKEGRYQPIITEEFARRVKNISSGLKSLGLKKGDKLIILSENRPEWVMVDLATICQGGITVPIYTSLTSEQIKYIVNDSEARFVLCSNPYLWEKVERIRNELPRVEKYILIEEQTVPGVLNLKEIEKNGELFNKEHPADFEQTAFSIHPMSWLP